MPGRSSTTISYSEYKPVVKEDNGSNENVVIVAADEGRLDDNERNSSIVELILNDDPCCEHHPMDVMEISSGSFDEDFTNDLFGWKDPWLPSALVTLLIQTPTFFGTIFFTIHLLGVWFAASPIALYLVLRLLTSRYQVHASRKDEILERFRTRVYGSIVALIDIVLMGVLYPVAVHTLDKLLLTEIDGDASTDWIGYRKSLRRLMALSVCAATCRVVLGINAIGLRSATSSMDSSLTNTPSFLDRWCKCPSYVLAPFLYLDNYLQRSPVMCSTSVSKRKSIRDRLICMLDFCIFLSFLLLVGSFQSVFRHFVRSSPPLISNLADCDSLDETECWLPFPSFHHMQEDSTSLTSWRLNLKGNQLPPPKTGRTIDPSFLNKLDGFSTMGPILFYIDGLKEAHEAGLHQLKGIKEIADSVTKRSVTLLWDVEAGELLPHSAEIDYLDTANPMVLMFPSRPLHHNKHYGVAVVNALDSIRTRIPPTKGMIQLLAASGFVEGTLFDKKRRVRYFDVLIPSLEKAASWFSFATDPLALQLLFDFQTISEDSQLGTVRLVRDTTIQSVSSIDWDWNKHVKTIRTIDFQCESSQLARTVHAEIDVPWFLDRVGSGARASTMKSATAGRHVIGKARFIVHIPCSLKQAALYGIQSDGARPLRAIIEYGHGLFGDRAESQDRFLVETANREGYILMAMDWRGMSRYDLLVTVRLLISTPELFEAMRDNMFQGFANKFALQHFAKNALLSSDWLTFARSPSHIERIVPSNSDLHVASIFYGISQGGILGAGYTALSGKIGLLDRSILTSAGTPFAFVMTRSTDFYLFDQIFRINFFNNRHVRSILALVQLGWDPVEASGTMALPVNEPFPPVLMQAGLGDPTVAASSSESLARAFNASTLPGSPRPVFGLSKGKSSNESSIAPHATFTEILYLNEYASLPEDNYFPPNNPIHWCLRGDRALNAQLAAFVNTGAIENPCASDIGCNRSFVDCF